ncbi:hypothetical protein [Archangium lipolyticum]|uniref:hypothetical protein n=1 Tax=Archangium lipolyticum TaxID=2970465 RepID=UPI002149B2C4|nr:hypothetical protein [Archangium lipolyticum]
MRIPRKREQYVLALKLATVLCVETALTPPLLAAMTLLGGVVPPRELLDLQNRLRRRTLVWMFPHLRG